MFYVRGRRLEGLWKNRKCVDEITARAIQEAFKRRELGKCARDRVCKMFSLEKREEKLIETLNNLVKSEE